MGTNEAGGVHYHSDTEIIGGNDSVEVHSIKPTDHPHHEDHKDYVELLGKGLEKSRSFVQNASFHIKRLTSFSKQVVVAAVPHYHPRRQFDRTQLAAYLLQPCGIDWLRSSTKLDNVLPRLDNRVTNALPKAQPQGKSRKSFIFTVNLQIPDKDQHNVVFYFATEDHIPVGSLLISSSMETTRSGTSGSRS
ncbi:hypothetical protein C1H46_019501 [Malus baccata]|uniref:Protein ENHANCED DISEASE RESISTANCE 2 C-terminal domain-containing protein n=1 Tax=Malus baccata TaxID=106549 RepID=A0A540M8V1_MALBA|nr:hypothetical protein C1H46_019501 [Malus baccata]